MATLEQTPSQPETTKPLILVVEDDLHSMHILERILTMHGFAVLTAASANEAKSLLTSSHKVDLILSDWIMPEIDGVELCGWVKTQENLRNTFFILVTVREETQDKVKGLDSGADDYVTKPYQEDELVARVRAGLRLRQLQREVVELERKMAVVQVAATAAHEINNPLTGVFGYIDLLRVSLESNAPKETLLNYVNKISQQAVRIRDTVARLSTLKSVQTKEYLGQQRILDLNSDQKDSKE